MALIPCACKYLSWLACKPLCTVWNDINRFWWILWKLIDEAETLNPLPAVPPKMVTLIHSPDKKF